MFVSFTHNIMKTKNLLVITYSELSLILLIHVTIPTLAGKIKLQIYIIGRKKVSFCH